MLYIVNEITFNGYNVYSLDLLYLIAILLGIFVIISKNPIVSVLFLIGLFLCISVYLILTGLNFIGLSYLLVYIGAVSIWFIIALITLALKKYFGDPIILLGLSCNLRTSAFYTGKGKGKAIDPPSPSPSPSHNKSSSPEYDMDADEDTKKAILLSLKTNNPSNAGPSNRLRGDTDSPVEADYITRVSNYISNWEVYRKMLSHKQKAFNTLKIKEEKQPLNEKESILLLEYSNACNELKTKMNILQDKLLDKGINPWDQCFNKTSSEESSSDAGSSDFSYSSSSNKSSNSSNPRSNKRVKYSEVGNIDNSLWFVIFNFTPVLRIFLSLFSAIFLLVVDFNILPKIELGFINMELLQLLLLCLIINNTKLIYRWYSNFVTLYSHYLDNDYMAIYFNLYYSIVIILLYLTSNSDIYILYF